MTEPAKSPPLQTQDLLDLIARLSDGQQYKLRQIDVAHSLGTEYHISAFRGLIDGYRYRLAAQSVGTVRQVGDGVAIVTGLSGAMADELVLFPDGTYGLALDLDQETVGCVLLGTDENIHAGDIVRETGRVIDVPVGEALPGCPEPGGVRGEIIDEHHTIHRIHLAFPGRGRTPTRREHEDDNRE